MKNNKVRFTTGKIPWKGFEPHYFPCMREGCTEHATEMVHPVVDGEPIMNICLCPDCADRVEGTKTLVEMNAFMEKRESK